MKRTLRPILSVIALLVVVLCGPGIASPRDICLAKVLHGACVCPNEETHCDCCDAPSAPPASSCCTQPQQPQHESPSSNGPCFTIASGDLHLVAPERGPDLFHAPVAVLALAVIEDIGQQATAFSPRADRAAVLTDSPIYMENCVYLI